MQTAELSSSTGIRRAGRQFGFGLAIAINIALLFIVQNLTSWDVFPFLTTEFDSVVPWISVSLIVSIAANAVYIFNDDRTVRALGDIATNVASLVATWRLFVVFPFDFSAYDFAWGVMARVVMIIAIVGTIAGAVAALTRLVRGVAPNQKGESDVSVT